MIMLNDECFFPPTRTICGCDKLSSLLHCENRCPLLENLQMSCECLAWTLPDNIHALLCAKCYCQTINQLLCIHCKVTVRTLKSRSLDSSRATIYCWRYLPFYCYGWYRFHELQVTFTLCDILQGNGWMHKAKTHRWLLSALRLFLQPNDWPTSLRGGKSSSS